VAEDKKIEEILSELKKINVNLQMLVNILSTTIDVATGGNSLNKDFLEDEVRKNITTG